MCYPLKIKSIIIIIIIIIHVSIKLHNQRKLKRIIIHTYLKTLNLIQNIDIVYI